jgi:hypothetical protein
MPKKPPAEKLILTSIRLPESLKSRLLHLQADGKIKSIQQATLDALDALATKLEKEK